MIHPIRASEDGLDPLEVFSEEAQQLVSQGKAMILLCCSPAIMHASHAVQESDSASIHQLSHRSRFSTDMFRLREAAYG